MPEATQPQSAEAGHAGTAGQQGSQPGQFGTGPESEPAATEAQLQAWAALFQQTLAAGRQLSELLQLELKLAVGDGLRLLGVVLVMLPLVILAWLGLSVLLAWLAFLGSGSVGLGLAGFLVVQLLALLLLWRAARVFQRSLGLPATRRQLRALTGADDSDGTKTTDS